MGQLATLLGNRAKPLGAIILGLLGTTSYVGATQPPDPVVSDTDGNTAMGTSALLSLTDGLDNTASGLEALFSNLSGDYNTAMGWLALYGNTTGSQNSGFGYEALANSTAGSSNTAVGAFALYVNTGQNNTAMGVQALYTNLGSSNSAFGYKALLNTSGSQNTAVGQNALLTDTTGSGNTAVGYSALYDTTTGYSNLAFGYKALYSNKTGENNIGLGNNAGYNVTGNYNIEIGNEGTSGDQHVIRIGAPSTQSAVYIAGISTTHLTGAAVYVNSNGQLGVLASSERYKTAIMPMGADTEKLQQLHPVTFHLKNEPQGVVQYGLIAEEVDKVYPELVIRDAAGTIQGIRYDELAPMLLNDLRRQHDEIRDLKMQQAAMQAQLAALMKQNASIPAAAANRQ